LLAADDNERKPYFEPREAKPDHPLRRHGGRAAEAVNQVVPPDIHNAFDRPVVSYGHLSLLYRTSMIVVIAAVLLSISLFVDKAWFQLLNFSCI